MQKNKTKLKKSYKKLNLLTHIYVHTMVWVIMILNC